MRILAFETSAKAASVALLADGVLLAEYFQNSGQTHSRTVMQMAEDLLRNCDLTAADLDAVAVAAGPGSFTGVRIGVAAAKGLAWGRQLPCYGVSTLESMARYVPFQGVVVPAMDARRSQIYTAVFESEDGALRRLLPDSAIAIDQLRAELEPLEKPILLVGDGAALCHEALRDALPTLRLAPEQLRMQRAGGVALAALEKIRRGEAGDGAALSPAYLRLSQAERERLEKNNIERSQRS